MTFSAVYKSSRLLGIFDATKAVDFAAWIGGEAREIPEGTSVLGLLRAARKLERWTETEPPRPPGGAPISTGADAGQPKGQL